MRQILHVARVLGRLVRQWCLASSPSVTSCRGRDETVNDEYGAQSGSVIHTPDRRLRVFVSSTLGELADERRAVARAISSLRLTPVMFELGATPHPPQD